MNKHLDDLKEIRQIMERSSKFLSLSGLSGISVGIIALIASGIVYSKSMWASYGNGYYRTSINIENLDFLILTALITFVSAVLAGIFFTMRKAKKKGEKVWNKLSQKMLLAIGVPLLTGAFVSTALLSKGVIWPIASLTLVFYGLALVNGSQYTFKELYYLGLCEIALGIVALFFIGYSLVFWAIGFGFLHILYGSVMYKKYDK